MGGMRVRYDRSLRCRGEEELEEVGADYWTKIDTDQY